MKAKLDNKSFEETYISYYSRMSRFAQSYAISEEDAENIVQDIFIDIWEKKLDLTKISNVGGYLFLSLKNKCIDYIRHKKIENHTIFSDYTKLFSVEGENNKEYIYRAPCIAQNGYQNNYMPHAFPPNYPIQSNWVNFGAQFRTYTEFYETFEEDDLRRQLLISEYIDQSGNQIYLNRDENGNQLDNVRSFKYWPDPNAVGEYNGNDIVYVRLADILLSKAEALNEKLGPNIESINLINEVRLRANATAIKLEDFTIKDELREFLLAERGREFYSEGLRREDLIRHEKFISGAVERGKDAKPHQVLFPIPQRQIEANDKLVQNEGYPQ